MEHLKITPYSKYSDATGVDKLRLPRMTILPVSLKNASGPLKDKDIYHVKAKASLDSGGSRDDDFVSATEIDVSTIDRGSYAKFDFGGRNPLRDDARTISLENFHREANRIAASAGEITIDEIIVGFDVSDEIRKRPVFEETSEVYHHFVSTGMKENSRNSSSGMNLLNMYEEKKAEFEELGLSDPENPAWFRDYERSRLVTEGLVTDDKKTHMDIVEEGSPNDLIELLEDTVPVLGDVSAPKDISGAWSDHSMILYELQKYDGDVLG